MFGPDIRPSETLNFRTGSKIDPPSVDFAFVDGGHDFAAVRHDFYSVLDVAAPRFQILFDDYAGKPGYGIMRLVDEVIAPIFETELIYRDPQDLDEGPKEAGVPTEGMVFIDSERVRTPLEKAFNLTHVKRKLVGCRRRAKRQRVFSLINAIPRRLIRALKFR